MKRIILTLSLIWAAILSYAQGTSLTRSEATDILLGECISQARSSMPMDFGAYSIDDIKLTKTSVTYSNTIPDKAAFNQSKSQAENLKVNTLTSFLSQKDQLLLTFMMCIESNRSLRYEYSCPAAGASFHFDITSSEMKELYDIGTITNAYRKEVVTTYLENVSETPFTIDNDVYSPVIFLEGSVKDEMDGVGDYEAFFRDILSESIQNHEGGAIFPAIAVYLGVGLNEVLTDKTGESITLKIRYSELVQLYKEVSSPSAINKEIRTTSGETKYYSLKKPVQNNNYAKYATEAALEAYNDGVAERDKHNYSKAYNLFMTSFKGGCDMAANELAYLYARGQGVSKDMKQAYYYADTALKNFKEKNLIYPIGDGFWYANVLDTKGEICFLNNDPEEAFKVFLALVDCEGTSGEETSFIRLIMELLEVKDDDSAPLPTTQQSDNYDEEPIPFQLVEVKPSFQGGDANKFSTWVNTQLQYPKIAKDNDVQGRVTLQFTVDVDGSVTNVKVLRGVDPSLDNEAMRVVRLSPKWTPGRQKGKPVRVTYTFPVIFQLTDHSVGRSPIVLSVPSNKIETKSHKWEVVSVELRDDCTYIHKRVTPKSSSTWVNSDTGEYIEDAQTGRKYYLNNSSLAISPRQTTLSSKTPHDFTETYPALPASVQYINISSGSQYYVKNLKIR